jgi:hypothetical protein
VVKKDTTAEDTALILEEKMVDRVRKAFVEMLNRDGDHWILDCMRHSVKQIIDEEFKRREEEMVKRVIKQVHPSRG